ncbi:MAG: hypothetical protein K8S94_07900 [Planctomycetia bacterium]|nr:hypothetical protein [Planctomycetia bacterium]
MPLVHRSLAIVFLASLAGCSAGRYDADYAARLAAYREAAAFAPLAVLPDEAAGGRVQMRLPKQFGRMQQDDGADLRAMPPFLRKFPGYDQAREVRLNVGTSALSAVITVGVVAAGQRRHGDIEREILEQVRTDDEFRKVDWQRGRAVAAVAGGPTVWDVLSLKGKQEFESVTAGNVEFKKWDGTCEIWVSADPKQEFCIVIAVRVPDTVAESLEAPPAALAELIARTVAIVPAADEKPAAAAP